MNPLIGSISQPCWEAQLAGMRAAWIRLVEETRALRAAQETTLRHALSGTGVSPQQAERVVALYFERLGAKDGPENLAGFVRHHHPEELPPPTLESVSALVTSMETEWQAMFQRLAAEIASPRSRLLAEARKPPGQPPKSLADGFLSPVDDVSRMHSPEEGRPVVAIALDAEAEKDGKPEGPTGAGNRVSRTIQQHLLLQHEIDKFSLFWTDEAPERATFVTLNAPQPARRVQPSFWRPSTWFDSLGRLGNVAVWRDPVPTHVPTSPELAAHLRAWRIKTENEADELLAAEAVWTKDVADLGKELETRRETERRHQQVDLGLESACQVKLEEAKALAAGADKHLQAAREELEWIAQALAGLAPSAAKTVHP